jgi:hypothetical protein
MLGEYFIGYEMHGAVFFHGSVRLLVENASQGLLKWLYFCHNAVVHLLILLKANSICSL